MGNQNAANGREWREAIKRAMAHKADGDYRKTLDKIAAVVVDSALVGEKDAWKEVGDRMDGKPTQPLANDPESPLINVSGVLIVPGVQTLEDWERDSKRVLDAKSAEK